MTRRASGRERIESDRGRRSQHLLSAATTLIAFVQTKCQSLIAFCCFCAASAVVVAVGHMPGTAIAAAAAAANARCLCVCLLLRFFNTADKIKALQVH